MEILHGFCFVGYNPPKADYRWLGWMIQIHDPPFMNEWLVFGEYHHPFT
jgi:hypothetical protein